MSRRSKFTPGLRREPSTRKRLRRTQRRFMPPVGALLRQDPGEPLNDPTNPLVSTPPVQRSYRGQAEQLRTGVISGVLGPGT